MTGIKETLALITVLRTVKRKDTKFFLFSKTTSTTLCKILRRSKTEGVHGVRPKIILALEIFYLSRLRSAPRYLQRYSLFFLSFLHTIGLLWNYRGDGGGVGRSHRFTKSSQPEEVLPLSVNKLVYLHYFQQGLFKIMRRDYV